MITVLAGGVGAARFLTGLVDVRAAADVTAIVNTGDDLVVHGLHVSPDLDTVTYTLAGAINSETGWGLADESWQAMDSLERFAPVRPSGSRAGVTWFRLGDRDLATHMYRTHRLGEGARLSEVTAEIAAAFGVGVRLLPMSDGRVETRVTVAEGEVGFQEYFVERRHDVPVSAVRFAGADEATPAPGVLDAIAAADRVVIAPSNPLVSIAPILAVPGIRDAVAARREHVVAVSPIIAGAALKGPADRMLAELGHERSAVGVARIYAELATSFVLDEADRGLAADVEACGLRAVVAPTIMRARPEAAALAEVTLGSGGMTRALEVIPVEGIGEVRPGDDLAGLIAERAELRDGDVVVVTQKIVSKAENRLVQVDANDPTSHKAFVEQESVRVLRRRGDLVISETAHGFVCANAGVDLSNVERGIAALLPVDSDRSARRIRDGLRDRAGVTVAVIVSDTNGRPWRRGFTDVAIGCAGIGAIVDLRGTADTYGRELQVTEVAVVDELAGAADLVMGKATGVPVAVVRGVDPSWLRKGEVRAEIVRPPEEDLFR